MDSSSSRFEDLNLVPGEVFHLSWEGYSNDRGKALLVGYVAQHSIIITMPSVSGKPVLLSTGAQVTLRFFVQRLGCICAFRTTVMHVSRHPIAYLHLEMPKDVVIGEVRRSVRAKVAVEAKVFYGENFKRTGVAEINDLSMGGCSITVQEPLVPVGTDIRLQFKIAVEGIERELKLSGTVRSTDYLVHRKTLSIQFATLSEDDRLALIAFVLSAAYF